MPSDKAAYLAAHYLTAEKKSSSGTKKRKRKQTTVSTGLLIQDDDETGWSNIQQNDDENDDDLPVQVAGTSAEFRRAKKSNWKTITDNSSKPKEDDAAAAAAADAIIASAAAEAEAARKAEEAENRPVIVGEGGVELPPSADDVPLMSNGTRAGLQSAAALTAQMRAQREAEREELSRLKKQRQKDGTEEEIILRDATGRRVDAAFKRAELRKAQLEAERKEKERQRLLKGEVQIAEARAAKEREREAALMPLARGKDDKELNEELKQEGRWHDPAAEFLSPEDRGRGGNRKGKKKKSKRRPTYQGAWPPNRYMIPPGYRWDGVDRGNGHEAERFKAMNRREMRKGLEYQWQMDE